MDVIVVGSFVQDLAFSTQRFPAPGESRIGRFSAGPGGKGFNQAVAAKRQGVDTTFIGACGNDMFAQQVKAFAKSEYLACRFETIAGESSGAASIVVNDQAQNLIVVALGANEHLSVDFVEQFAHEISSAKVVVCQLECHLAATARALEIGRQSGAVTVLNPAPINDAVDPSIFANVDILVPNETEFAFFSEHLFGQPLSDDYWTRSDAELHELCRAMTVPTVIITLGDKGSFVSHHGVATRHPASKPCYRVDAANVSALDTTGAGDAFCGGLAAGLARHGLGKLNSAVLFATQVAGLSTEKPGTAPAMPTDDEWQARFGA